VTDTCFDTLDPIFGPGPYGGILYQRKFFADPNPWIERTFPDIFGRYDATHVDCIYPCLWGFAVWGGQTAAYSVGAAGKPKIWVGRPAGDDLGDGRYGRPQPVPGSAVWGEQDDRHPSYAPAGNWIAVDRSRQDIFRLSFPPDSRGFDRLTKKGHNTNPDWGRMPSPD
jgi:hypothetical protein